jgi:hypothetical protein
MLSCIGSDEYSMEQAMETKVIEKSIKVQAESCNVTARQSGEFWKASGIYKGEAVYGASGSTHQEAFDNWKNRADMLAASR